MVGFRKKGDMIALSGVIIIWCMVMGFMYRSSLVVHL